MDKQTDHYFLLRYTDAGGTMNPFFSSTPAPGYTQLHNQPSPDTDTLSTWEIINSPMSASTQSTNTTSPQLPSVAQDQATKTTTETKPKQITEAQPPRYNDISGAVIIDWDGSPRFLSPQEEQERQTALENAVREKMLGLPRKTEFAWARPDVSIEAGLPAYSPGEKEMGKGDGDV